MAVWPIRAPLNSGKICKRYCHRLLHKSTSGKFCGLKSIQMEGIFLRVGQRWFMLMVYVLQSGWRSSFASIRGVKSRASLHTKASFCSMKWPEVFLLSPGWDARPLQGYPQHKFTSSYFFSLDVQGHCESKVSCPRTQHNVPGQGLNPHCSIQR